MKVLIVGSGGREHALAWKLDRDQGVAEVLCAPGNPGIASIARTVAIKADDVNALCDFAERENVTVTVVGPEQPLDAGIADAFSERGLRLLGPTRAAAQLECSKVFAKNFMARHGIPTARYRVAENADDARSIVRSGEFGFPIVLKADGLAAGKGVIVAADAEAADRGIRAVMDDRQFGNVGARLVIEECMTGPEVSFFVLADGRRAVPILSAQDHKRIFENDEGPNTGGMGAFAPSPLVDQSMHDRIMREIVDPAVAGMRSDGHEYRGFLYAGLMLTCTGPKVIEFNVRFGDPEAQVVLPMIEEDLSTRLIAAADGNVGSAPLKVSDKKLVGVVLASAGYPGPVTTHKAIEGLTDAASMDDVLIFHSGTETAVGRTVTAGGRVLTVVGTGSTFESAIARAYAGVSKISFDGMQHRRDIGKKALNH